MRINSKIALLLLFFSTLCLTGCLFKKQYNKEKSKNSLDDKKNYLAVSSLKTCSFEESITAGLHIPPYASESRFFKNKDCIVSDAIFESSSHSKENVFHLLRDLYVNDGWTFTPEAEDFEYKAALCKKVGKEIYIFIEEKTEYNKKKKEHSRYLFLHQSLFLTFSV